ncbi:hypothetical protein PFISCL1PPCAC_7435, partial [Pristionchus fissidentatus]
AKMEKLEVINAAAAYIKSLGPLVPGFTGTSPAGSGTSSISPGSFPSPASSAFSSDSGVSSVVTSPVAAMSPDFALAAFSMQQMQQLQQAQQQLQQAVFLQQFQPISLPHLFPALYCNTDETFIKEPEVKKPKVEAWRPWE